MKFMHKWELTQYGKGYGYILGCDEVGRGSLAGPVVAGAVILNPKVVNKFFNAPSWYREIRDSKLLKPNDRQRLAAYIKEYALAWSVAEVAPVIIDAMNIHRASLLAMKDATLAIIRNQKDSHVTEKKFFLAVDGKFYIPDITLRQAAVVRGDRNVLSIAAASILAKVHRDELMMKLHQQFPVYNFRQHKGYATPEHQALIKQYGISPVHRVTFCKNIGIE
jgi:ribonuclease HII